MSSSPAWGTLAKPCIYKVSLFFTEKNIKILADDCQTYREPLLKRKSDGMISHIEFYYTPLGELKKKRVRFFSIPGETEKEKLEAASICMAEISNKLRNGTIENNKDYLNFKVCYQEYLKSKSHLKTSGARLEMTLKPLLKFIGENELTDKQFRDFPLNFAENFRNYLFGRKLSNRTINNYCTASKTLWNYFLDKKFTDHNVFEKIKKISVGTGRNLAFLPNQIKELKILHQKFPDLEFLAMFMYYTLLRTNEISNLKVKHFLNPKKDQIYLPSEFSKNGFERYVTIPKPLQKMIDERKIRLKNTEWYVFGRVTLANSRYKPIGLSPYKMESKNIGHKYREQILDKGEFSKDYTLYSWKHTGVVNAHNAGIPDADIMQQTGHRSYESFTKYMKSLGLFKRGQYADRIPEI